MSILTEVHNVLDATIKPRLLSSHYKGIPSGSSRAFAKRDILEKVYNMVLCLSLASSCIGQILYIREAQLGELRTDSSHENENCGRRGECFHYFCQLIAH